MPRALCLACAIFVSVMFSMTVVGAANSPYPATLTLQSGLTFSSTGHAVPWGTKLTAAQVRAVTFSSSGSAFRWGVWQVNGPGQAVPSA